jgi:ribokinase
LKLDVIGFGAINYDRLYRVDRIVMCDEESFITGLVEAPGGSAANTVVALARLGRKVGYVGRVGCDREGQFLLSDLERENVDTAGVSISDRERSGVVIGFVDEKGERAMYVSPGANDTLNMTEKIIRYVNRAKVLHLTSFVGKQPFDGQKQVLENLSKVRVSFDPGVLYARKAKGELKPILQQTDVMFPNEREVKLLTGAEYKAGAQKLIDEGAKIVAVKLGKKGSYVTNGREQYLVEPYRVNVVDTTGAGDAYCAGFLHGLLSGKDLKSCGQLGNLVAAHKIEKAGAREGLPRLRDLPESHR